MKEEEITKSLENLGTKIDNLSVLIDDKETDTSKLLENLGTKVDNLSYAIKDKKIGLNENLLIYLTGAFVGGLIMGLSFYKRAKE